MYGRKQFDKSGRRLRHARPVSDGKSLTLTDADYLILEWLNHHGPLPTHYLYEPIKHLRRDYTYHQKRLARLRNRNDTPHDGRYLIRPRAQWATMDADQQRCTYDITKAAITALRKREVPIYPDRIDPMKHRFMNACTTASMRIALTELAFAYVTLPTIMAHRNFPEQRRKMASPLRIEVPGGDLIPDDLQGIGYTSDTFRFFALEDDRSTETLEEIERKLRGYIHLLKTNSYMHEWGVPNLYVMILTVGRTRMQNIIKLLYRLTKNDPHLRKYFLFRFKREFAGEWQVPEIMRDLVTDPWERADLPPFFLTNPHAH